ncbi:unnamed protein product [Rhizoctonia solani]|nr:unnamed protein product [Rhizoctonia solani]
MSSQTHVSGSVPSERTVLPSRKFTGVRGPISSPMGSILSTSVIDEHSIIDKQIDFQKHRYNQQARIIEENAAHEVTLATEFATELCMLYPEDTQDFQACLAAETADIHARAAAQLQAQAHKLRVRINEIHM